MPSTRQHPFAHSRARGRAKAPTQSEERTNEKYEQEPGPQPDGLRRMEPAPDDRDAVAALLMPQTTVDRERSGLRDSWAWP